MSADYKFYVACLAAYNNGRLHGAWIDATQDVDDIMAEVQTMLEASPEPDAEEWAIHDYDGFGGLRLSEYESFESVHMIACFLEEYPDLGPHILDHFNGDIDEARGALEDQYQGCYESLAEYAQNLTEETTTIPQHLEYYVDYDRMGRDMEMNGDVVTIETAYNEVHVFWAH